MPDDEKFDDFVRRNLKDYNAPVPPPADAIWASIEKDVAEAIRPRAARPTTIRRWWIPIGVGIAATLMIGAAVGRWSTTRTSDVPLVAVAPSQVSADDSARIATHARATMIEHLEEAEVFLTSVRADLKTGRADTERTDRSRELLSRTRLLLGASASRSPEVARLLEDLELLLAEIAAVPQSRPSMDLQLLDEKMRQGNVLPRIRATLPAQSAGA